DDDDDDDRRSMDWNLSV
ncbi:hypothetical protein Tco_0106573, partial [Tanacetum coccineum]